MKLNIDKNKNQLTEEDCQRVANGEDQPQSYDKAECIDCTNRDCPFMPPSVMEQFDKGELDALFPNGQDDGCALDKEDANLNYE
jgi:hypothetical protein